MKKYVTLCEGIHVDSSAHEIKLFEVQGTLCLNTLSVGGAGKKNKIVEYQDQHKFISYHDIFLSYMLYHSLIFDRITWLLLLDIPIPPLLNT